MKEQSCNGSITPHLLGTITEKALIKMPLVIGDICIIQDAVLVPGFHYLAFEDVASSRMVINECLRYRRQITGRLTTVATESTNLNNLIDIYMLLLHHLSTHKGLDDFFIEFLYYDLLWIELNSELLQLPWFMAFEKNLIDFNIGNTIPIVVISFQ